MKKVCVRIEEKKIIGTLKNPENVGRIKAGEVFFDKKSKQIVICQAESCVVIS